MATDSRIVSVDRIRETLLISLQDGSTLLLSLDELLNLGLPRIIVPTERDDALIESLQKYLPQ